MTDVSITVMGMLTAAGALFFALKSVPLVTARAFIYAGCVVLFAHVFGIKVVAPVSETDAETIGWSVLALQIAAVVFLVARGLVWKRQLGSAVSELAS